MTPDDQTLPPFGHAAKTSGQAQHYIGADPSVDETPNKAPEKELRDSAQKIAELTEISKRALADLANYKKQAEKDRAQFAQFANVGLILEILPVIDNFKRATEHLPENLKNDEWVRGLLNIENQLFEVIKKQGVNALPSSVGQKFDPHLHEAVIAGPGEKDIIIEEFECGYVLGEKLIRPAKVKVGDGTQ